VCKCGFCGAEKQALSEWERHTGSKSRNWRTSIRVKDSMLPLEQWVCIRLLFNFNNIPLSLCAENILISGHFSPLRLFKFQPPSFIYLIYLGAYYM